MTLGFDCLVYTVNSDIRRLIYDAVANVIMNAKVQPNVLEEQSIVYILNINQLSKYNLVLFYFSLFSC